MRIPTTNNRISTIEMVIQQSWAGYITKFKIPNENGNASLRLIALHIIIPLENYSQNTWQKQANCTNHIEHVILKVIQTCNHVTILKNTYETKGAFQSLQRKTQNKNNTVSTWISINISGDYVCLSSTWWPEQLYYLLNCAALLPSPPMNPTNQQI